jgi:hypothetical protein
VSEPIVWFRGPVNGGRDYIEIRGTRRCNPRDLRQLRRVIELMIEIHAEDAALRTIEERIGDAYDPC